MKSLGEKLKALRRAEGETLKEVSDALDMADGHLAAIESGKTPNPGIVIVAALAEHYGVTVDSLVNAKQQLQLSPETSAMVRMMEDELSAAERELMLRYVKLFTEHKLDRVSAKKKAS